MIADSSLELVSRGTWTSTQHPHAMYCAQPDCGLTSQTSSRSDVAEGGTCQHHMQGTCQHGTCQHHMHGTCQHHMQGTCHTLLAASLTWVKKAPRWAALPAAWVLPAAPGESLPPTSAPMQALVVAATRHVDQLTWTISQRIGGTKTSLLLMKCPFHSVS